MHIDTISMELSILYLEGVVCQIVYKLVHIVYKVDYFLSCE